MSEKPPQDIKVLRAIPLFQALSDRDLMDILGSSDCYVKDYAQKNMVIREGEIGDCMFMILNGSVEVLVRQGHNNRLGMVATLTDGDFFGEEALLPWRDGRRNASIKVSSHSARIMHIAKRHVLHGLEKGIQMLCSSKVFGTDLKSLSDMKFSDDEGLSEGFDDMLTGEDGIIGVLRDSELCSALSDAEINCHDRWTSLKKFGSGDFILRAGDKGDCLYIIKSGIVELLYIDDAGKLHTVARKGSGEFFGEQALLPGNKNIRNTYARADGACELVSVSQELFNILMKRDRPLLISVLRDGEKQRALISKLAGAKS